jgi:iron complex transport system permease protein
MLLTLALVGASLWYLCTGSVETGVGDVWAALFNAGAESGSAIHDTVIWQIRLPRLLGALLIGAALTLSGALLQGLFRNPLADPALIGVSSGAAMGAVLAIVGLPLILHLLPAVAAQALAWIGLPLLAMLGAVGLTFLIYRLSLVRGRTHVPSMLLTGIAVNAVGGAFVGLMVTVFATDEQLRTITFWTLGSLSGLTWTNTAVIAAAVAIPLLLSLRQAPALNALLLGETEALHLGVRVQRVKRLVIVLSAVMVGITVAFCGIIGFVGLVVPHIVRTAIGPDHRLLLPAGSLLGAAILLTADGFARILVAPAELQIGILTALLGGPFFLALLLRARRGGLAMATS